MLKRLLKIFLYKSGLRNRKKPFFILRPCTCSVGEGSIVSKLIVEYRGFEKNISPNVIIGNSSLISGSFVLELNTSQIRIGSNTYIGGSNLIALSEIEIGDNVFISWGCTFLDNNSHPLDINYRKYDLQAEMKGMQEGNPYKYKDWTHVNRAKIVVKDNAWIGFNVIIMKGVIIGEGAIIGSGSVVTTNVPDYTVYAGNPASLKKKLVD